MKNGTIQIGFADPYKVYNESEYTGEVDDIIYLWTWDNIDESTHRLIGDDDDKYLYTPSEYALRILIYYDFVIIT